MTGIVSGAQGRRQNPELVGRLQDVGRLEQEKSQIGVFALAKKLIGTLQAKFTRNIDQPDAQSVHKKDESDNQLWKIYSTHEMSNPRPPMDIFR